MQVGTEFARQFYYVLTQQPSLAHRFYTDGSSLTHSTGGQGVTVHGQAVRVQRSPHDSALEMIGCDWL